MALLSSYASGWFSPAVRNDASTSALQPIQSHYRSHLTLPLSTPVNSVPASHCWRAEEKLEGESLCISINQEEDLYAILGIGRKSTIDEIRRAFLGKSKIIHPDKLPHYPPSTPAFQRLSFAYETLSKPASRRLYDLGGGRSFEPGSPRDSSMGDETLHGVLRSVFNEFLDGDFESIRAVVNALNEGNPGLNLGDEAVDNLEGAFKRVREALLAGQQYLRTLKFELIRLYEIQHSLRALSYFDVIGRLRLTLALTRVSLEIPLVLDKAMRAEPNRTSPTSTKKKDDSSNVDPERESWNGTGAAPTATGMGIGQGELQRRGLLGPRVKGVLVVACAILSKGEKFGM